MSIDQPPVNTQPVAQSNSAKRMDRSEIKGIYLTSIALYNQGPQQIIEKLHQNNFNAVVINVKNNHGMLTYTSDVPLASKMNAVAPRLNLSSVLEKFHQAGIYTIARQVIFYDPQLATYLGQNSNWINPTNNEQAIQYNLNIAQEIASTRFDEIQFDYARFQDTGGIGGDYSERSRTITSFVKRANAVLPSSISFSIDVFGRTLWEWNSKNKDPIGQNLTQLQSHVDFISPMIYPSHYVSPKFVNDPYNCVSTSLRIGNQRLSTTIRPFIQGFDREVPPRMTLLEYLKEEIQAVKETTANGFLVWNPSSDYSALWKAVSN